MEPLIEYWIYALVDNEPYAHFGKMTETEFEHMKAGWEQTVEAFKQQHENVSHIGFARLRSK